MKYQLSILFLFFTLISYTQQDTKYSFEFKNTKLRKALIHIEDIYKIKFSYMDQTLDNKRVSLKKGVYSLSDVLSHLTKETNLVYEKIDKRYYAVYLKEKEKFYFNDNHILSNVIINAYLTKGISKNKDNSFSIYPQKLGILPGLTEPDVLKTLQQLPGIISPNETVSGIHVRGGTPDQNLIIWNGIQIYHNGHLFGMISGFNSNIDQKIDFYNKGTNPKYGGKISSVISIKTSNKIPEKIKASGGINLLNFDLNIDIPIIKKKLKLQLSGRRSFTDFLETMTYNRLAEKVFQNTTIANKNLNDNIFYFRDYNAKIFYQVSNSNTLTISSIYIDNKLDNLFESVEDNLIFLDLLDISNEGYSLDWSTQWNSKFSQSLKAFYSYYDYKYQNINIVAGDNDKYFIKENKILDSGLSYDSNYQINDNLILNAGYQYLAQDVTHAFISKNEDLTFILDSKAAFLQTHSLYSSLNYDSYKKINLNGGLRMSYIYGLNKFFLEPRFVLNYQINENLKASITGESKTQVISQIKETIVNELGLENQLWTLSDNKKHPILRAKQLTTGFTYIIDKWTFDIDSYYKKTNGLTTLTFGFLNNVDPNFHFGKSYAYGSDFYMKRNFKNLKTWMTYSFNSTNNLFENLNDDKYFPVNSEVKHAINIALSYQLKDLHFALGWYWHSGKPYTNIANIESKESNELIYEKINGERLPDYHRLDISSAYHFKVDHKGKLKGKFGISLYNVYNQKNLLNREYYKLNELDEEIKKRDRYSLLFMPNMFFRLKF